MECIFCKSENPAHANFCMNCGSPQNLKLCDKCGAMNDKNAVQCVSCKTEFLISKAVISEAVPVNSSNPLRTIDIVSEAEALAQEATKFKQFIKDLQMDTTKMSTSIKEEDATEIAFIEKLLERKETNTDTDTNIGMSNSAPDRLSQDCLSQDHHSDTVAETSTETSVKARLTRRQCWTYLFLAGLVMLACGIGYYLI